MNETDKRIIDAGRELYNSIKNNTVQNLAGEILRLNTYYVKCQQDTYGTDRIMKQGFTTNQEKWLRGLDDIAKDMEIGSDKNNVRTWEE